MPILCLFVVQNSYKVVFYNGNIVLVLRGILSRKIHAFTRNWRANFAHAQTTFPPVVHQCMVTGRTVESLTEMQDFTGYTIIFRSFQARVHGKSIAIYQAQTQIKIRRFEH